MTSASVTATFRIGGMTCSACSNTVERALVASEGVCRATVSCVTNVAKVEFDPALSSVADLLETIDCVGFDAALESEQANVTGSSAQTCHAAGGPMSVELRVHGMTCGACSGTVERHLLSLEAVEHATVSLVLGRAFVHGHSSRLKPEDIVGEIEVIGFDAELIAVNRVDDVPSQGRADLHVDVSIAGSSALETSILMRDVCQGSPGILQCQTTSDACWRVTYDPYVVGGRRLLRQLREGLGEGSSVKWVEVSSGNEQLRLYLREIAALRWEMRVAVPIALVVLAITMLPTSLGLDSDHLGVLSLKIHHGVDVRTMLILALAAPVQFIIGRRFHLAAYSALKRKSPNMDVLVSVATNTTFFYSILLLLFCFTVSVSVYTHELISAVAHFLSMGPIFIAVVLTGKFLESRAKLVAIEAISALPSSQPTMAWLCGSVEDESIPVELVELGDIVKIFAGACIPVDGILCSQQPIFVDESLLTGESCPVEKGNGDALLGGTTCLSGGCLMRVTNVGTNTVLGQMYQLVQDAQASKAHMQRVADRVARFFVPSVVCLSFVTFVVWAFLVFSGIVVPPKVSGHVHGAVGRNDDMAVMDAALNLPLSLKLLFAMKFGMAVLMIACPCAMGLATPMAIMVSTGVAAKRGCLVKSAAALENAGLLNVVVLDKTGTLTEGAPSICAACCLLDGFREGGKLEVSWRKLRKSESRSGSSIGTCSDAPMDVIGAISVEASELEDLQSCFWWVLATLESASDHPVAKSIQRFIQTMDGLPAVVAPSNFEYLSGRGVRCSLDQLDGMTACVGNMRLYEETLAALGPPKVKLPSACKCIEWANEWQAKGCTVVLLHVENVLLGAAAFRDPIKKDAAAVVDYLTKQLGLEVWLCTGDNSATAQSIGKEVGISNIIAEALPTAKSESVEKLQQKFGTVRRVAFVGDGINDSLALAKADVGLAFGVGAHVAVQAADISLVRCELSDLANLLVLARATYRTILLNFFWAFCFNFVCLPLAAGIFYPTVHIPPLAAGIGMSLSSLLVVCTSLRLRGVKPALMPRKKDTSQTAAGTVFGRSAGYKKVPDDM